MYGKDSKRDKLESLQELKKNFDKYYSWKFVIWRQLYIVLKILKILLKLVPNPVVGLLDSVWNKRSPIIQIVGWLCAKTILCRVASRESTETFLGPGLNYKGTQLFWNNFQDLKTSAIWKFQGVFFSILWLATIYRRI